MTKESIGHNNPPKSLEDFYLLNDKGQSTGRIKLSNTICKKYLVRKYDPKTDAYLTTTINDSEKPGLKARISQGGTKSFYYVLMPKGKKENGKRFNPVYYQLGNFPEMGVEAARSLVDDLKHAIKLGKDPKSIIKERQKAKRLFEVIEQWKDKVLHTSTRYAAKTIEDTEQRFKNWIDLEAYKPQTNRIILNYKKDLSIGAKRMVEITKDDLVAWHAAISKAGTYQANRCIDDIKVVFEWALEHKILKENICKFKKTELNDMYFRLDDKDPYTREEWRELRKAALKLIKQQPRVFLATMGILLAMFTGRRYKSEILSLKWGQVDWDSNKVRLPRTKTGKSEFSINRLTRWILRSLWQYRTKTFKGKKVKSVKAQYLFPATRKSKKPYIQDIRKTWLKVCAAANVRAAEPYILRHTWGCLALEATNGNVKVVKDEGGWKTYKMVERYAKYNEKKLQDMSEKIGHWLARAKV